MRSVNGLRSISTWVAVLCLAPVPALAESANTDALRKVLASSDPGPAAIDQSLFGSDVDQRLIAVAEDSSERPLVRSRAVEALAAISTERAVQYLRHLTQSSDSPPALLAPAISSVCGVLAGADRRKAFRLAERFIDHADWMVRYAAARALGHLATPAAEELLYARWNREKSGVVRLGLSVALLDARHRKS
jgi:hypothetical protein